MTDWRLLVLVAAVSCHGAEGVLRLKVIDEEKAPVSGVVLAPSGGGSPSNPTTNLGLAVIRYQYIKKPYKLTLDVKLPVDRYFISPYDQRVPVPDCTDADTECFETVLIGKKKRKLASADLRAIAGSVISLPDPSPPAADPKQAGVSSIADQLGLSASELDTQLQQWAGSSPQTVESLLYRGKFDRAEQVLKRETPSAKAYEQLAVAQFYQQKLPESASSAAQVVALRPWDTGALNNWGIVLSEAKQPAAAQAAFRTARAEVTPNGSDILLEGKVPSWRWLRILILASLAAVAGWAGWRLLSQRAKRRRRMEDIEREYRERMKDRPGPGWGPAGGAEQELQYQFERFDRPFDFDIGDVEIRPNSRPSRNWMYLAAIAAFVAGSMWFLLQIPKVREAAISPLPMVAGSVFDIAGSPVRGATVRILGSGLSAATDSDGAFQIQHADKEGVVLRASKDGYEPAVNLWLPGDPAYRVRLTLRASEGAK